MALAHQRGLLRLKAWGAFLSLSIILGGCAGRPDMPSPPPLSALFGIYAQVIIRQPSVKAQRFFIVWRRLNDPDGIRDEMEVKDSFGSTQAQLIVTPQRAFINYQDKRVEEADSATLAERLLGYSLPIEAVGYWLNAEAHPDTPATMIRQVDGQLRGLNQYDWKISYLSYDDKLPDKMTLLTTQNVQVDIRILRRLESPDI